MGRISIIVAMDSNGVIGHQGALPWSLPEDLKQFKRLTTGKPVVMGRKTYESIGRPLPHRRNIVITRQPSFPAEGVEVVHSLEEALQGCSGAEEIMIIGGAAIYREALDRCHRMYITEVQKEYTGDTWFPAFMKDEWAETFREKHVADDRHRADYDFVVLDRKDE